ncbi:DEAD/DEAH box helicase family protein [Candidatus Woesebacteria bacterium]|nr:DEAD/DEAH box helicase family protein [Candidatus Woesebacteria bacterium]
MEKTPRLEDNDIDNITQDIAIEDVILPVDPEPNIAQQERVKAPVELSESEREKLEKRARIVSSLRELIATNETQEVVLFDRQVETLTKITDFIDAGGMAGYVKLPTGVGKTVIFAKLIEAFSRDTDDKTIICGPTKIVAGQNTDTVEKIGNEDVARYFGRHKELNSKIVSTTYSSFRIRHQDGVLKTEDFDLVILDEAHRSLGDKTRPWVDEYKANGAFVIGFTASPDFHDEKKVVDLLPYEIDYMDVKEAIEGGALAPLKVYLIKTQTDLSEVKIAGDEYDQKELSLKVNSPQRNELIVEATKGVIINEHKKGVVYCVDRQHARDIADEYIKQGVTAEYIGGDSTDEEVTETFKRFNSKQIQVLCNAGLLIEGFNDAELDLVINAKPTLSKVDAEQRGGRALRLDPHNPNKVAVVIDTIEESQDFTPILYSDIVKAADIQGVNIKIDKKGIEKPETDPYSAVLITDSELVMELTNKRKMVYENLYDRVPVGYVAMDDLATELEENVGEVRAFIRSRQKSISGRETSFLNKSGDVIRYAEPMLVLEAIRHFKPQFADFTSCDEISEVYNISKRDALRLLSNISTEFDIPPSVVASTVLFSRPINIKVQELIEQGKHEGLLSKIKNEFGEHEYLEKLDHSEENIGLDSTEELDPSQILSNKELEWFMAEVEASGTLDERSTIVIKEYYLKKQTLDQVGKIVGVTRERVRQLLAKACREIRDLYSRKFSNMPVRVFGKIFFPAELQTPLSQQSLFSPENVHLTRICEERIRKFEAIVNQAEWQTEFLELEKLAENSWNWAPKDKKDDMQMKYTDMRILKRFCDRYNIGIFPSVNANQFSIAEKLKFLKESEEFLS